MAPMPETNEPRDIAYQIGKLINRYSFPYKEVAELIAYYEHPTLQQNFMRLCIAYIEQMAKKEYTDLRNNASYEFAKKVMASTEDRDRYLPYV